MIHRGRALLWFGTSRSPISWWRHQMKTFSSLLALCEGNAPVTGGISSQRPVTQSFDVFFDLRLNKTLSKQSRRRCFQTSLRSLWRHCNGQQAYFNGIMEKMNHMNPSRVNYVTTTKQSEAECILSAIHYTQELNRKKTITSVIHWFLLLQIDT